MRGFNRSSASWAVRQSASPLGDDAVNVAVVQLDSCEDRERNLAKCERFIRGAKERGAHLVVFPENVLYRGKDEGFRSSASAIPGPVISRLAELSHAHRIAVVWGAIVERGARGLHNSCVVIGADGALLGVYRKIHLFELFDGGKVLFREADLFAHGSELVTVRHDGFTLGLSICYDLRFPELYRSLLSRGADVLLAPSDFTRRTGKAHWLPLLTARAIENLSYVVAPNQCGKNTKTGAFSHGHSAIISPWGELIASCDGEHEGMCMATLDRATLLDARQRIRALDHRRPASA